MLGVLICGRTGDRIDAGSGAGALQTFQQIGGALGIALVGELFFASLQAAQDSGTASHEAFVDAIGNALWYQIGAYALVALLVPFSITRSLPVSSSEPAPNVEL